MQNKFSELLVATKEAKRQSISMKRKLLLYWVVMALAVFALFLVVLSFAGVFSDPARKLNQDLEEKLSHTYAGMTGHFDTLAAQCIQLSEQASAQIEEALGYGVPIQTLNDQPERLLELQRSLYAPLNTLLQTGRCSGAFLILDATVNTKAQGADHSRGGLYLRYASLSAASPVNQHVTCFRGSSEIARTEGLELHNRWNLEFDIDYFPGYRECVGQTVPRLSDGCFWTPRINLRDTWEDALLLCVPIVGSDGAACGLCGVELSSLYFQLAYSAPEGEFGHMIVALGSSDGSVLRLSGGALGGQDGTHLDTAKELRVGREAYFNTYATEDQETYLGLHRSLPFAMRDSGEMTLAVLMPEQSYRSAAALNRMAWIGGSLAFLLAMLALAMFFSRRFVKPIVQSLEAIQQDASAPGHSSGISEIDALEEFINRQSQVELSPESLPPEIRDLIDAFTQRAATLTGTERTVLSHYISGSATRDIPELMCISASTAKVHNRNLYRKLGVNSYDELKAYIDILQRCGQIDVLLISKGD